MSYQKTSLYVIVLFVAITPLVSAQPVHIPDPNLREAINERLDLFPNAQVTASDMAAIIRMNASDRDITSITGLEHASNLIRLDLGGNNIIDLTPIAGLTKLKRLSLPVNPLSDVSAIANLTRLTFLDLGNCEIIDITPLKNLTTLVELQLNGNHIHDLRPLAGLSQLTTLNLQRNDISDVSPLAHLTQLNTLTVHGNNIADHSAISGLSLTEFIYDPICGIAANAIRPRLENRTFPSVFGAWSDILNLPNVSYIDRFRKRDLYWSEMFGLRFLSTTAGQTVIIGPLETATRERDANLARNPNMIFLVEIRMRDAGSHYFPEDSPYWVRDATGQFVGDPWRVIDFTHPHVQDMIVQQALAVSKCGLYDGIFIDWWNEDRPVSLNWDSYDAEQRARDNIVQRIRAATRPDFLIMVNTNVRIIPRTGKYINGGFMETGMPNGQIGEALEDKVTRVEQSLLWLEQNLREPQINGLEGSAIPSQPPDSPDNLRWMRVSTTLSLTHSDGYVVYSAGISHNHYWYDFWDADLGRPVGEKRQLYQEIEGLYIREFTNGWAVYNHSGEAQVITLPEEVQGVASGLVGAEHALPNLDGEMYLRVKPKNPADLNGDGVVNIFDLTLVAQAIGTDDKKGDVNGDGVINVFDLVFVANQF